MAKKAAFVAASFANLRAAAGEGTGEPLRIPLVDIDLDADQPRKRFDPAALEVLADTIRRKGLLQPVGVHPPVDGRYKLAFGERRYRASKLAGMADIPAVIVPEDQRDYASQVIENQQRADLSNSELAAAVNQLHAEGKQGKEIAAICNLKDYQIAAFRAVEKLPDFLRSRLDHGDIRAIYDLYRAWQKHPEAGVQAAMPDADTFLTITEARRIIMAVTGKPSGSIVLAREQEADAPASAASQAAPAPASMPPPAPATRATDEPREATSPETAARTEPTHPAADLHGANSVPAAAGQEEPADGSSHVLQDHPKRSSPASAPTPVAASMPSPAPARVAEAPVFIMETTQGVQGVLVTDARPGEPGWAYLDVQGERIGTPFTELRCVNAQ